MKQLISLTVAFVLGLTTFQIVSLLYDPKNENQIKDLSLSETMDSAAPHANEDKLRQEIETLKLALVAANQKVEELTLKLQDSAPPQQDEEMTSLTHSRQVPKHVSSTVSNAAPNASEKDQQRWKDEFADAKDSFDTEAIDYDWAGPVEKRFYEHINNREQDGTLLIDYIECRETMCEISLVETNIADWITLSDELRKTDWWNLSFTHFSENLDFDNPQNYRLLIERQDNTDEQDEDH